jgi:hypothetical protein
VVVLTGFLMCGCGCMCGGLDNIYSCIYCIFIVSTVFCIVSFMYIYSYLLLVYGLLPPRYFKYWTRKGVEESSGTF